MSCSSGMEGYTRVVKPEGGWHNLSYAYAENLFDKQKFYYLMVDVPGRVYGSNCHVEPLGYYNIWSSQLPHKIFPQGFPIKSLSDKIEGMKMYKYTFSNGDVIKHVYEAVNANDPLKKTYYPYFHNKGGYSRDARIEAPVLFLSDDNLYTNNDENSAPVTSVAQPAPTGGSKKRKQRKTGRKRKSKRTKTNKKLYKR